MPVEVVASTRLPVMFGAAQCSAWMPLPVTDRMTLPEITTPGYLYAANDSTRMPESSPAESMTLSEMFSPVGATEVVAGSVSVARMADLPVPVMMLRAMTARFQP